MKNSYTKLFNAYYRAEANLENARDKEFPVGTKVYHSITGSMATVKGGSLYAHQVNTDIGHMSWTWLEIINISTAQNTEEES